MLCPLRGMGRCPWILKRAMKITEECDSVHLGLSKSMRRTLRLSCSLCLEDYKGSKVIWKIWVSCTHYENASFSYLVVSHLEIHPLSLSHKNVWLWRKRGVCGRPALARMLVSYHSYKGHQNTGFGGLVGEETVLLYCTSMAHFVYFMHVCSERR